jgi:hypothetical protein
MRAFTLLLSLATLWGCSSSVLVSVPPRMDLSRYGTLGIVEFASNAERGINALATRRFQEQVQSAQPGTPFIELGSRETLLAAVGAKQLDADAVRKVGEKYRVNAIFVGDIVYSDPKTDVRVSGDLLRLEGDVRTEIRADMSAKLLETRTGASIWSSSSWARRQLGGVSVSAERGVSGGVRSSDPREEMVQSLVFHLTQDFRPSTARQRAR